MFENLFARPSTIDRFFDGFADGLDERGVPLVAVGISDVDQEVARWRARACSRITIHSYSNRLRAFFRHVMLN